jgi:PAS domain S-box-containing protein
MTAAPAPTRRIETAEVSSDDSPAHTIAQSLRDFASLAGLLCRTSFASIVVHGIEFTWQRDSGRPSGAFPEHRPFDEHALSGDGVFEVSDARRDRRFQSAIVFYAATPLRSADGRTFGILSVLDFAPRELDRRDREALAALGRQASSQAELTEELLRLRAASDDAPDTAYLQNLRQLEMLHRNTFEQAPIGIAYADKQGHFIRVNPAFGEMLGYSPAELENIAIGKLTYEADFGHNAAEIDRLWRGEIDAYSLEKRYLRKDGSPIWVRVTATLVLDESGAPNCSVGFLEAISDRKQMQQAMEQNRNLLSSVISDVPVAIMACDRNGQIFLSNPAAVKLFSIDTSTASGDTSGRYKPQIEVFLPDGVTRVPIEQTPLPRALRGEQVTNVELILVEPGGKARTTLGSARRLFGAGGECMGAVAVAQDITERKEAELELERTHKQLLDASRFAGMAEVASNVLHNVGNVLTSVNVSANLVSECVRDAKVAGLGRAAAMLKEREKDLSAFLTMDERGRKLPAYLSQLADHLQGNQRLALKELAALRDNIEHIKETVAMQQSYAKLCGVSEIVAVNALIEDSLRMNAAALTRHGVSVNREIDGGVPAISVDKHKVLQILVNLIRNAKYACDDTERQDKQITIRVNAVGARVRIAVIDNGVGISPENMGRLFRHGFTTRKTGHGFGLHSGALAAKELGGSLTAHSDGLGCGASFTLDLPIEPPAESAVGEIRE